ncbi:MAG: aminoacyl-tRNA hydrolase [Oscillospiraceae bacterium]|nr:aminoacyl-tRNA hydrolase [Oscillospiraceae bacterium]
MISRLKDFFGGYQAAGAVEYIVAGLGNPGREYETTRHNAGFLAVDLIREQERFDMKRLKFRSLCGDTIIAGKRVLFLKPSMYMNKSGECVRDAMQFYKIPPERTIIIFDDVNLDTGRLRIRQKGSDGGQKGMQNIIYLTGRDDFPRVRIGVGKKPHPDMKLADWVLSRLTKEETKLLIPALENAAQAVRMIVAGNIEGAMGKFNG